MTTFRLEERLTFDTSFLKKKLGCFNDQVLSSLSNHLMTNMLCLFEMYDT